MRNQFRMNTRAGSGKRKQVVIMTKSVVVPSVALEYQITVAYPDTWFYKLQRGFLNRRNPRT